ncbi:MAG: histone deacetylase [Vicinamibacterales bacterium]
MILYGSHRFTEHVPPPGHPERPERAELFDDLAAAFRAGGGVVREPRPATREELLRVHTAAHVDRIDAVEGRPSMIDADTFTSPDTVEVARLAAGAAVDAALEAWRDEARTLALVRPPGHHAEPDRAMGFCFFNNIAVAAAALRAAGAARVAIVDIDVHHGNGTQAAFYEDPTVLFVSSHQFPYYPGTGAEDEIGRGAGEGYTLNLPLPAGTGDAEYERVYATVVLPALERFRPDIVLVSAGFDAHERDPLGQMRLTTGGYLHLVTLLDDAAARLCRHRLALVTEGGYDLDALRACLEGAIRVLD